MVREVGAGTRVSLLGNKLRGSEQRYESSVAAAKRSEISIAHIHLLHGKHNPHCVGTAIH
jgi:hypothetical protein